MYKITYRITTLSPVLFAMNVGDTNMVSTREYIPGSVIMGLFAGRFIQKNNLYDKAHEEGKFYDWFLKGDVKFTNANIVFRDDRGVYKRYHPVPLSMQHEKGNDNKVYDLLFADDEDSDKQTVYKEGFGRINGKLLYRQPIKKSLNFHHQRDSAKGTVKEIFNYESIDACQTFEGDILGGEKDLLKQVMSLFNKNDEVYIGRSRNAQYGKVRFEFVSEEAEGFASEIEGLTVKSGPLSLTLLSNTIIHNENGFSTTEIPVLVEALKGKLGKGVTIKKAFVRTDEVENFVSVWRLRKPSEVCFMAGSCFLLEGVGDTSRLNDLQKNGIGERRGEGLGRIAFGWQENYEFDWKDIKEKDPERPTIAAPPRTQETVQTVARDFIRKKTELNALNKVKDFVHDDQKNKGLPTKSLIGRLEAMVITMDRSEFLTALKDLRDTAKKKLEGCKDKNGKETLFGYLEREEIKAVEILRHSDMDMSDINKMCNEIGWTPESDIGFDDELYRTYFLSFFSEMRRILKKE